MKKGHKKGSTPSVTEVLNKYLEASHKTQRQIAEEVGYDKPNIITMFKQGLTKVPIDKVPALAKALGINTAYFLRIVMSEYEPEVWEAIENNSGMIMTSHECEIIRLYRMASGNTDEKAVFLDGGSFVVLAMPKWEKLSEAEKCFQKSIEEDFKDVKLEE